MTNASHRRRATFLCEYRSCAVFRSAYPAIEWMLGRDLEALVADVIKKAEAGDKTAQRLVARHHLMDRNHR
jgi:hypothetical protein